MSDMQRWKGTGIAKMDPVTKKLLTRVNRAYQQYEITMNRAGSHLKATLKAAVLDEPEATTPPATEQSA